MAIDRDLPARIGAVLRQAPVLPLALVAILAFVFMTVHNAGHFAEDWYPPALVPLALLVVAAVVLPRVSAPPRPVAIAVCLLAGYAAWSYLSITWASQNADAWDGANRTALYAVVFALFALWPFGWRAAAFTVGTIALVLVLIALIGLLKADPSEDIAFIGGRYTWPAGYPNGTVALWFIAFWPCIVFGARRELHPVLRGVFLGGAVLLAGTALLSQSRGWLFSLPIVTAVFVSIVPNRVRTVWALIGVGAVTVAIAPAVLDVFQAFGDQTPVQPQLDSAQRNIIVAAILTGMVGGTLAMLDRRVRVSAETSRNGGRAMLAAGVVLAVVGLIAFVAKEGSPVSWLGDKWAEFKTAPEPNTAGARFTQTLGSNRYDFWRVAWNRFEAKPITGIGADNFRQDYLVERKSTEEPYYPHSMLLRTFAETGLVGVLLFGGAVVFGLIAAMQAIRRRWRTLGGATAAAATTSFIYFGVHGSVDWFFELPALGCLAFACLGIAAGLVPRTVAAPWARPRRTLAGSAPALAATVVVGGLIAASYVGPWLSARTAEDAREAYNANQTPAQGQKSLDELDHAAALNPFAPRPRILQGKIDNALGQLEFAARDFQSAIDRDPKYQYAYVALAAIESARGRHAAATAAAREAVALSPRDQLAIGVLNDVRAGRRVDFGELERRFSARASERVQ